MTQKSHQEKTSVQWDPQHKIVNPQLAQAALNSVERFGDFKAYIRVGTADRLPPGFRPLGSTDGLYAASIPCGEIEHLIADSNVLSVELREYVTH